MQENALYLEVDEDITSAIDKLKRSKAAIVKIVVPKRSTLLQSVINQKLLKKAATDAGKKLVLVTNDRVAIDLASRVGLAVAPALGAAAIMPTAKAVAPDLPDDVIEEGDASTSPPPTSLKHQALPDESLASKTAKGAPTVPDDKFPLPTQETPASSPVMRTREISDAGEDKAEQEAAVIEGEAVVTASTRGSKGPRVPNFSTLQRRVAWLGLVVVVIIIYFVGMYYLSSANITIYADGAQANVSDSFSVNPSLTTSDPSKSILAGQTVTLSHNLSTTFTPTGSENVGTEASGNMTIYNSYDSNSHTFPTGTTLTAPDGNIFQTSAAVTVPGATAVVIKGQAVTQSGSATVQVTASAPGDTYNEAGGQKYTIPSLPSDEQSGIYGQGAQMSGGTSKTVTVVQQSDVTTAVSAALAADKADGQKGLLAKVASGDRAIVPSISATSANVSTNPGVGDQGTPATLTLTVNYTMLEVKNSDFAALVHYLEQQQLGSSFQIYTDGLSQATVTAATASSGSEPTFTLNVSASGGPKINTAQVATALKGMSYSNASDYLTGLPQVVRANIVLKPVWSTSIPHIVKHIHVSISVNQV